MAWTRIQRNGKENQANKEGVKFHIQIIDELLQQVLPHIIR